MLRCFALVGFILASAISCAAADAPATLNVDVRKPGPAIPPNFFGLMTEEINHSYDGGLFAELIQNRTFQDPGLGENNLPIHWSVIGNGSASINRKDPVDPALPISLRLNLKGGEAGIANDGFWGIPVRPSTTYTATFYAKSADGFAGPITASLLTDSGNVTVARADSQLITAQWQKYSVTLTTGSDAPTTAKARFVLSASGNGSVSFSFISLFPPTYENVPNGLRPDLMKLLAGLHPKFIRLPGGNYVEGSRFADRFNWKQMIGPADHRPGHMGCWSYRSSDGFGMPEYLLWCKQLGAEPVLAVFAGYTLNGDHFNAGTAEMAIYTQEALDEIEYVSGPADSKWGKQRAADGFTEPFPLHFVEIGNEDWFDRSGSYDGRFAEMANAIRHRYPQLKIIATAPVRTVKPDLYDDHYYRSPRQLARTGYQYGKTPDASEPLRFSGGGWNGRHPDGIKTFVGEWASQEGRPTPDLNAALGDAVFLMSLEQNADAVIMESYAPLFVNVSPADPAMNYPRAWQWQTNLIGYDALHSFGSPAYYAQAMLSQNKGDFSLPTSLQMASTAQHIEQPHGAIGVASWHTQPEYTDISVTGPDGQKLFTADLSKNTNGWDTFGDDWNVSGGALRPASGNSETWAIAGDPKWTNYTLHLRARKVAGQEGFMILWHALDGNNFHWWNIGGWGNTVTRCEATEGGGREGYGPESSFTVETGRWYDLRLEVTGNRMRGYIDRKLITDARFDSNPSSTSVFASANYVQDDKTLIINVVNTGNSPVDMAININGASQLDSAGTAILLTGDPRATNSVDQPTNVAPKTETITNISPSFHRQFPAHSLTVLRLKTTPE